MPPQLQGAEYCSDPAVRAWTLPFPGADASVVRRTQAYMQSEGEQPVHFGARCAAHILNMHFCDYCRLENQAGDSPSVHVHIPAYVHA